MNKASEAILALKPVSFRYKKKIDPAQMRAFGLIAEEVDRVDPDLVAPNRQGQPESVRYEQINAMLLNEFVKAHKTIQEQNATIVGLKSELASVIATVKEQAAQIQKVNARIDAKKPRLQVALNDPDGRH